MKTRARSCEGSAAPRRIHGRRRAPRAGTETKRTRIREGLRRRDIYALEFQIFKNPLWSVFYTFSVLVFITHYCLGWQKVTPALGIPKGHVKRVEIIGYIIGIVMGLVHISFPLDVMLTTPSAGYETEIQNAGRIGA